MKTLIVVAVGIAIVGGGGFIALANEVGKFCEEVNPYNEQDSDDDIEAYVEEINNNPHVFCFNECCIYECPKHKNNLVLDNQYLYALMKDTIYCPYQEEEYYDSEYQKI